MVRETKVVPDHPYKGGILKRLHRYLLRCAQHGHKYLRTREDDPQNEHEHQHIEYCAERTVDAA